MDNKLCKALEFKNAPQFLLLLAALASKLASSALALVLASSTLAFSLASNAGTLAVGMLSARSNYDSEQVRPDLNVRLLSADGTLISANLFQHSSSPDSGPSYAIGYGRYLDIDSNVSLSAQLKLQLNRAEDVSGRALYSPVIEPTAGIDFHSAVDTKGSGDPSPFASLEVGPRATFVSVGLKFGF